MDTGTGTCLRCGAPYEADATVCYTCGAPIGETKTPTQPVRAVKSPRPAAPEPAPVVAPTSVPARPAPVAQPASSESPARRRWPVALAVCLLVLFVLGGAAYAVRVLTAPPPVATQAVFHDPQHRFSFQRPALWQVTPTEAGADLSDASGTSTATVTVSLPPTPVTGAQEADRLAAQLGLQPATAQTIAGQPWERRSGQVTGSDGAVRQMTVLVTVYGGELYTIQLSSPVASFSAIDNAVYEPLLASFTFS